MSIPLGLLVPRETRQRYRTRRLLHPGRAPRARSRAHSGRPPKKLADQVKRADRWRCVYCGQRNRRLLQVDHIVPWIMGGLTWFPNLATLCKACNGTKGIYWMSPQGKVYYHATWGRADLLAAAAIHDAEISARRSPLRAARAA